MTRAGGRDLWRIDLDSAKGLLQMFKNSFDLLGAARTDFADIEVPAWVWAAFLALLAALLCVDLVLHRGNHVPTARRALIESAAWVACGLGFSVVVLVAWGGQAFGEYLSGYVIEKSLSIDNVFVWAIIFSTFAIPLRYQHRVLFWGIFGALALRAVFILGGSALHHAVLVDAPGVRRGPGRRRASRSIRHRDDEGAHGHDRAVKLLGRFIPVRPTTRRDSASSSASTASSSRRRCSRRSS